MIHIKAGVSNSNIYAGHILKIKVLASRMRIKVSPRAKSFPADHINTVISTIIKVLLIRTLAVQTRHVFETPVIDPSETSKISIQKPPVIHGFAGGIASLQSKIDIGRLNF